MSILFAFLLGARHNRKAHQYGDSQLTSNRDTVFLPLDVSHFGSTLLWDELRSSQQCETDAVTSASTSTVMNPDLQKGSEVLRTMHTCMVCLNDLPIITFPSERIFPQCIHDPSTCLRCLQDSIKYDHYNKIWDNIRCPEVACSSLLSYYDVQKYADRETFIHYHFLALQAKVSAASDFVWCLKCSPGQFHQRGTLNPIVRCQSCNQKSCLSHQVVWHEGLTCEEFSRQVTIEQHTASTRESTLFRLFLGKRRPRLEASRLQGDSRVDTEITILVGKAAEEVEAKKAGVDEEASLNTIRQTTKTCPGCSWPIEKNEGCDHMKCINCRHSFCFECLQNYDTILHFGNPSHRSTCRYHTDNF
ncbi:hypothetical protein EYC80_005022 [Monilinia laxa]|uniref:RBR-type E3 ubiquitin transferase n=1 Tax=Monilinia laxa TaxID=61186 RepID=A0A5N6KIM7_MONLA|nr:hypothetical protein EYC80_005022 [Monilinia laxa]